MKRGRNNENHISAVEQGAAELTTGSDHLMLMSQMKKEAAKVLVSLDDISASYLHKQICERSYLLKLQESRGSTKA